MSPLPNNPTFQFRVRYAECTAHGDLAMAGYINFFSEAAAQALSEHDVDIRMMTAREGARQAAGPGNHPLRRTVIGPRWGLPSAS